MNILDISQFYWKYHIPGLLYLLQELKTIYQIIMYIPINVLGYPGKLNFNDLITLLMKILILECQIDILNNK